MQIKEFSRVGHWSNGHKGPISRIFRKVVYWSKTRAKPRLCSVGDWLDCGFAKSEHRSPPSRQGTTSLNITAICAILAENAASFTDV